MSTPSIGLEQPGCVAWEPAFAQDLEWCFLEAVRLVGVPGGTSAYFRLSTRALDQDLAQVPDDPLARDRRRADAVAGGYRLPADFAPDEEDVTLVGTGAIMPEVLAASTLLAEEGVNAGVVCVTSADLLFRAFQTREARPPGRRPGILSRLLPTHRPRPLVTVQDGHPHTLSFLAGVRGDRVRCLGVTDFGQSSDLPDAYQLHGIDTPSVVGTALDLLA